MKKKLNVFLLCHTVLWTFLPLIRKSLPMDSLEAIVWGNFWEFGTNKHPPLSGFIIAPLYKLLCESPVAVYLASQLCILAALLFTYKLGKLFLQKRDAVFATMLMEGIVYYTVLSCEYNVNIVSLALWPMNTYYFFRAMKTNRMKHWILLGFTAGLNLLSKYTGGVLLACFGAYLLTTPRGRAQMKRVGAYVTATVCLLTVAPHLLWLARYDFYALKYVAGRAAEKNPVWTDRFYFPLKFLLSQIVNVAGAVCVFFGLRFKNAGEGTLSKEDKTFLIYTGVLPAVMLAFISFAAAIPLKTMWGTPFMYLTTVMLFAFFPIKLPEKKATIAVYALMALFALIFVFSVTFKTREKVMFDGKRFAADMAEIWREKTNGAPFAYVGGDIWYISHVALFSPARPTAVADDLKTYPWLDAGDIAEKGALLVVPHPVFCDAFTGGDESLPLAGPEPYVLTFKSLFGKKKKVTVYTCVLKPKAQRR